MSKPHFIISSRFITVFCLILLFLLAGCGSLDGDSNQTETILLAHAMHPSHPVSMTMEKIPCNDMAIVIMNFFIDRPFWAASQKFELEKKY